ncbi:MAG TPA: hypothetical protein VJP45_05750 [Candidatus Limnocylindria bacterium]|nr:hypothetical protein [Candidatus Limnocylindria bacterium]
MDMRRMAVAVVVGLAVILLAGAVALAAARGATTPGRQTVRAPIDAVDVVIRESAPPQVSLRIKAGLPSGCAQRDSHSVTRTGDTFTVTVLNSMPTGDPICTMIYGTYELTVELGSDFRLGGTYTVQVNDRTTTFKT